MESHNDSRRHVLILGGTTEGRLLAERLAQFSDLRVTVSLAGSTKVPIVQPVPTRFGGFGGVEGLTAYLRSERVSRLIVATHPFASSIARNALEAATRVAVPVLIIRRPPWAAGADDHWVEVGSADDAVEALGSAARRVFVTIGRQQLAALSRSPQHHYVIRTVDPPDPPLSLPHAHYVLARGPFAEQDEFEFMRTHAIERLLAKNSGGDATSAKLAAARRLKIPVLLIRRPAETLGHCVHDVDSALRHLVAELGLVSDRGV
jgi:precorrin-6A/cobalt-precorrin-6A reductase